MTYSQYVFQFIVYHLWASRVNSLFWIWCVGFSIAISKLIDVPVRSKKYKHSVCGCLIVILVVFLFKQRSSVLFGTDIKLNMNTHLINPSLQWYKGSLHMAVRNHHVYKNEYESSIALAKLNPQTLQIYNLKQMAINQQVHCESISKKVLGEEDPRLFVLNNEMFLTTVHHRKIKMACQPTVAFTSMRKLTDTKR